MTGKSINQEGKDHVVIFPNDCTATSVSTAQSAQRNTGRVNRECQAQVDVLITALSVQHTYHYVKHILHGKANFPLVFVITRHDIECYFESKGLIGASLKNAH